MRWLGTAATVEPHPVASTSSTSAAKTSLAGSFTEVIPVHRLAYSFGWEGREKIPPGSSLIEIDLIDQNGRDAAAPNP